MSKARFALTLKQFMVRQEVLKQYRSFFRTIRLLEDENQKKEISQWVRSDFKANASVKNSEEERIKALLFHGDKMLRELKQSLQLSKA